MRELALLCLELGSTLVVLAECAEDLAALPSPARSASLEGLQRSLETLDIRLVDYYRFLPDCVSLRSAAKDGFLLPR